MLHHASEKGVGKNCGWNPAGFQLDPGPVNLWGFRGRKMVSLRSLFIAQKIWLKITKFKISHKFSAESFGCEDRLDQGCYQGTKTDS